MLWLIAVPVSAILLFGVWWLARKRRRVRGIKQYARDPAAMRRVGDVFRQREELLARAGQLTDEQLREGVEHLLGADPNLRNTWIQVFAKAGRRAERHLLAALDDPRCNPAEPVTFNTQPPFDAVAGTLARLGSAQLVARLAPLLRSGTPEQRKRAAFHIAMTGSDPAVQPTLGAVGDPRYGTGR